MFGGAQFNRFNNRHVVVNDRIWVFNFEKLEWSILPSLTIPRPTYFHAAAMNEVHFKLSLLVVNVLLQPFFI